MPCEYQALSQLFYSPLSLSSRGSLVPICVLPLGWCHLHICGCWYFSWQSLFQFVIHPAQHFTWYTLHNIWISRVTIFKPCHTPFTILNQSIVPRSILTVAFYVKEINLEYSLEGLMLKLQYFGHLIQRANSLKKTLMLGKIEGRRRRGWQRMKCLDSITDYGHEF